MLRGRKWLRREREEKREKEKERETEEKERLKKKDRQEKPWTEISDMIWGEPTKLVMDTKNKEGKEIVREVNEQQEKEQHSLN